VKVADNRVTTLFPSAITAAFSYERIYVRRDSLLPGEGYWIKFATPEVFTIVGYQADEYITTLRSGWNLVGSSPIPLSIDQLDIDPCNALRVAPVYVYDPETGYSPTDTIEPGKGAWVKVNENGVLFQKEWIKVTDIPLATLSPHPIVPGILFGATSSDFSGGTSGAILKSIDGGTTWDTVVSNVDAGYGHIIFDPSDPNTMYAGLGSVNTCRAGILKSTDGGNNWFRSDSGLAEDLDCHSWALVHLVDPKNVKTLYATAGGIDIGNRIYKSTDGGAHWSKLPIYGAANCLLQSWFQNGPLTLAIDPQNTNVIYAGTELDTVLYWSTDAGSSWSIRHCFRGAGGSAGGIHSIWVHPADSNKIFLGAGGFFRSIDRGISWDAFNDGLGDFNLGVEVIPTSNPDVFYAHSSCFYRSMNGGTNWEKIKCDSMIAIFEALDEAGRNIYISNPEGVYKMRVCIQSPEQAQYSN
jgi:photosystem II stability/assembly factor-like uncharacterized protein